MDKMKFETPDMTAENVEKIAALFPNCVTEMKDEDGKVKRGINFELLKQMLSPDVVEEGKERYEFTWVGKKASIVEANKPIRKTLRPCLEESKNWDTTENLYIEGDNLEVLKLLQESYLGKVKMIYIDPPYNTGNDFIYADDFMRSQKEEDEQMGMYDENENRLFKNTDTNGKFHSDWCSMMYSRLMLARSLLTNDGVIFISIDDNEQTNLKKICDEAFGEKNFINIFSVKRGKKSLNSQFKNIRTLNIGFEFVLVYSKSVDFSYSNPFEESNEKQKQGSWAGLYNNVDRPTMRYQIGEISIDKGQWKWGKEKGLRAYQNWLNFIAQGGTEETLKEYWEKNREEYQITYGVDLEFVKTTATSASYWVSPTDKAIMDTNLDYYSSGDTDARRLLGNVFSAPKPTRLIKKLIDMASNKDSTILDFFSGSATTAHAVMQLNAEDGGHRKFIMVQLPEPCDEKSESYKAGYKNICEIGKERIRRAGEKIKAENGLIAQNLDIGFRVLKLDDSNMKDVYYSADEYTQSNLFDMVSNIKDDRTDLDLLFGCLLDWGLPLSMPYISEKIAGCTVHTYNNGDLIACFDENIPESVVKEIARRKPLRAVFRDSGFASSPSKINVFEIFKLYMPEDADDITKRVRVI